MIRIREPQGQAFSEAAWERFRDELAVHLKGAFPARTAALPRGRLEEVVASSVAAGRDLGMTGARTLTVFTECALVFGPPPWREPFAAPLKDRASPPEVQHARFVELATEALSPARAGE